MKGRFVIAAAVALVLAGCGQKQADSAGATAPGLEKIVVVGSPAKAPQTVLAAKKEAKGGDSVLVEGKVKDFVEGAAVFTIVDGSVKSCKDRGHGCTTPWDYCCEQPAAVAAASATVKVVGGDGQPLMGNIKGVQKLDHLTTVAVEGKAVKDDQGNLTVEAEKVYIKL